MNLPNKLTVLRILLVPVMVVAFYVYTPWGQWVAAGLFVIAAVTDIIDGRYARAHGLVTDFGKLMDPIADKILVCTAYILLASDGRYAPWLTVCCILFIAREFVVSGLRLVAAGKGQVLAADKLGKLKTLLQCVSVVALMLHNPLFGLIGIPFDLIVTIAAAVMSVVSCINYIYKNRAIVNFKDC